MASMFQDDNLAKRIQKTDKKNCPTCGNPLSNRAKAERAGDVLEAVPGGLGESVKAIRENRRRKQKMLEDL